MPEFNEIGSAVAAVTAAQHSYMQLCSRPAADINHSLYHAVSYSISMKLHYPLISTGIQNTNSWWRKRGCNP